MSEDLKKQLKEQIAGFDKIINDPSTAAPIKAAMEKAKARAMEKLDGLGGVAPKKEEGDDAPKKEEAPKKEKKARKPYTKKAKAEKKPEIEAEEDEFITVRGKVYNINDCEEAIAAAKARKSADQESNKKTKTKSKAQKAEDRIELAAKGVADLIPEKTIKEEPKKVISALDKFEADQSKALVTFLKSVGVSAGLIKKLEKAFETAINPIIEEIKAEIRAQKAEK